MTDEGSDRTMPAFSKFLGTERLRREAAVLQPIQKSLAEHFRPLPVPLGTGLQQFIECGLRIHVRFPFRVLRGR